MLVTSGWKKELVLVGGGHAHALALRMLAMESDSETRITLVSLGDDTPYSGMLPGLVAGHYSHEQIHIDLRHLCARLGVRFISARAAGIDLARQRLLLADRPPIVFDALSFDIGSQPSIANIPGADRHAVPVKPIYSFFERWQAVKQRVLAGRGEKSLQISVVGGGAGSVELALAMARSLPAERAQLSLICAGILLESYSSYTQETVRRHCRLNNIVLVENNPVTAVSESSLQLEGGTEVVFDEVFWCTQATAAAWLAESGLTCDEDGFLKVRDTLQLLGHDNLFAAGDVATQVAHPRPKAGVYAVRQAPTLAHNLAAKMSGQSLREYIPQRSFLSMLSLGSQTAVAEKGLFRVSGGWVWRWKNRIDKRFMEKFEDLPASMGPRTIAEQEMHCGGCGAKLPGANLRSVLAELSEAFPNVVDKRRLVDDAVGIELPSTGILYQSVDVLRAFTDDPWLMGRAAVLHALSDLHAMGVTPSSVLAHITLPYAGRVMQQADLYAILAGACQELQREGAILLGGHTLEGPELSVGFTVNGWAGNEVMEKTAIANGDQLILCKPLGTGVLFAAQQQGMCRGGWISDALDNMMISNAGAASAAAKYEVRAATDVTGFGLLGHLAEMLVGTHLQAHINSGSVPLLAGVETCFSRGIASTLQPGNMALVDDQLDDKSTVSSSQRQALFDPQTCGGLLLAVSPENAEALSVELRLSGYKETCIIGEVGEKKQRGSLLIT